jgi:hypothetical protein
VLAPLAFQLPPTYLNSHSAIECMCPALCPTHAGGPGSPAVVSAVKAMEAKLAASDLELKNLATKVGIYW